MLLVVIGRRQLHLENTVGDAEPALSCMQNSSLQVSIGQCLPPTSSSLQNVSFARIPTPLKRAEPCCAQSKGRESRKAAFETWKPAPASAWGGGSVSYFLSLKSRGRVCSCPGNLGQVVSLPLFCFSNTATISSPMPDTDTILTPTSQEPKEPRQSIPDSSVCEPTASSSSIPLGRATSS